EIDANAVFDLGPDCRIKFSGGFEVKKGTFKQGKGSHSEGEKIVEQGKRAMAAPGAPGVFDYYVDSSLEVIGGSLEFEYTPGARAILHVAGNLTIMPGSSLTLNVDGSASEVSDVIQVDGIASVSGAELHVNTQEQTPDPFNTYTFLTALGGITGTGWAA